MFKVFSATTEVNTNVPVLKDSKKIINKIAHFWDDISDAWQHVWGYHIHHGYQDDKVSTISAEEKLIEKICEQFTIVQNAHILDVGCGLGGSSIYLAQKYKANVTGITLSARQKILAEQNAQRQKLDNIVIKIDDAHGLSTIADNSCDIVWSLESCEQFYDKELFMQSAHRVLKPGGKIMIATWCAEKNYLTGKDAKEYVKLCKVFDLPYMPTLEFYNHYLNKYFNNVEILDWSQHVNHSWRKAMEKLKNYNIFQLLKMAGWKGVKFVKHLSLMNTAFREGRIRYGVFLATK